MRISIPGLIGTTKFKVIQQHWVKSWIALQKYGYGERTEVVCAKPTICDVVSAATILQRRSAPLPQPGRRQEAARYSPRL